MMQIWLNEIITKFTELYIFQLIYIYSRSRVFDYTSGIYNIFMPCFYLDRFVSGNVEFYMSHKTRDWKQRRKVNQSMPKATLRGDTVKRKKALVASTTGIES